VKKKKKRQKRIFDLKFEYGAALGAAMALPIMRQMDYESIMRKAVTVTPIPAGALPDYDDLVILTEEEKEELRIANKPW
jgi:hypothetical protein